MKLITIEAVCFNHSLITDCHESKYPETISQRQSTLIDRPATKIHNAHYVRECWIVSSAKVTSDILENFASDVIPE